MSIGVIGLIFRMKFLSKSLIQNQKEGDNKFKTDILMVINFLFLSFMAVKPKVLKLLYHISLKSYDELNYNNWKI